MQVVIILVDTNGQTFRDLGFLSALPPICEVGQAVEVSLKLNWAGYRSPSENSMEVPSALGGVFFVYSLFSLCRVVLYSFQENHNAT